MASKEFAMILLRCTGTDCGDVKACNQQKKTPAQHMSVVSSLVTRMQPENDATSYSFRVELGCRICCILVFWGD